MTPEQQKAANKVANLALENLDSIERALVVFEGTYEHSVTAGLRAIRDAARDYERRKYMG